MNKQLSAEQIAQLEPFEQYFGPAIRSGYSSYPGEANLQTMRNVWADLTGQNYPYHPGCSTCIFNIVKDLGLLYYAATGKDPYDVKKKVITYKHPDLKPEPAPEPEPPATEAPAEEEETTEDQVVEEETTDTPETPAEPAGPAVEAETPEEEEKGPEEEPKAGKGTKSAKK